MGLVLLAPGKTQGDDERKPHTVKQLAAQIRNASVVVNTLDISGEVEGTGAGFVISKDGLIATCHHVVREGRPIKIEFADGREFDVEKMHAFDRTLDLAILKINATDLDVLPLGVSDKIEQGERVVAIGNPLGLDFTVVDGVISALRDEQLDRLIQITIPIERGNSGGPVLNMHGEVLGIVSMKDDRYRNIGFAVPVKSLKLMLDDPNPIPMERWITFGRLNQREWTTVFAAQWSQRGGVIHVDTPGTGFGGRALCISKRKVPKVPYEVAVDVKLEDESGAAGLAFESDGQDVHYGFYPTSGNLRLTRFNGPNVFSWQIFETLSTEFYQPGEWNYLKVRVEEDGIKCFLNDALIIASDDKGLRGGRVGLAKFRHTKADFKNFQVAKSIPSRKVPLEKVRAIEKIVKDLGEEPYADSPLITSLQKQGPRTRSVLQERAKELEREAERVRLAAELVHFQQLRREMMKELAKEEDKIDLLYCSLLLSKIDKPELDVAAYRKLVNQMGADLKASLPQKAGLEDKLKRLNQFLFEENGYHGNRDLSDSCYIDHALDNREGLPITLSIIYIELAKRIGLNDIHGAQIPGHFMVCHMPKGEAGRLIDVFERGKIMSESDSSILLYGDRVPASKRSILGRMVRNLISRQSAPDNWQQRMRYLELGPSLEPNSAIARLDRSVVRYQSGNLDGAREDATWLLENKPRGIALDRVRAFLRQIDKADREGR